VQQLRKTKRTGPGASTVSRHMHGTAAASKPIARVVGPENVVGPPPGITPTVGVLPVHCAVRIATWMWTGVRDDLTAANKAGWPTLPAAQIK
jgi:hypothetical protein